MAEVTFIFDEEGIAALIEEGGVLTEEMLVVGEEIKAEAIKLIKHEDGTPPMGIKYPNNPNISSAPGQAPMTQSGELAASVEAYVVSAPGGGTMVRVGADAQHGTDLELGTRYMQARPWLRPAVTKVMMEPGSMLEDGSWAAAGEIL